MTLHPADPADRIIVALDGMAPEQAFGFPSFMPRPWVSRWPPCMSM